MKTLLIALSLVCGCGGAMVQERAVDEPAELEAHPQAPVQTAPHASPQVAVIEPPPAELASLIRAKLEQENAEVYPEVTVAFFESVAMSSGTAHVFRARLNVAEYSSLTHIFVVAVPSDDPEEGEPYVLFSMELGSDMDEPGAEQSATVSDLTSLRVEGEWIRGEVSVTKTEAEFATDGECQQRRQTPTVRRDHTIACGVESCSVFVTALAIVEPGYERDCEGNQTPAADDLPEEFQVSLELDGDMVRVSRVSGAAEDREVPFSELDRGLAGRLIGDE